MEYKTIILVIIIVGWILYIRRLDRKTGCCGWKDMRERESVVSPFEMVSGAYKMISNDYKNGHIYPIDVGWYNRLMDCIGSTKRIDEDVSQEEFLKDLRREYNMLFPEGPRIDKTI